MATSKLLQCKLALHSQSSNCALDQPMVCMLLSKLVAVSTQATCSIAGTLYKATRSHSLFSEAGATAPSMLFTVGCCVLIVPHRLHSVPCRLLPTPRLSLTHVIVAAGHGGHNTSQSAVCSLPIPLSTSHCCLHRCLSGPPQPLRVCSLFPLNCFLYLCLSLTIVFICAGQGGHNPSALDFLADVANSAGNHVAGETSRGTAAAAMSAGTQPINGILKVSVARREAPCFDAWRGLSMASSRSVLVATEAPYLDVWHGLSAAYSRVDAEKTQQAHGLIKKVYINKNTQAVQLHLQGEPFKDTTDSGLNAWHRLSGASSR